MNDRILRIIKETAEECGVTEFKMTKVVENVFNYLRNGMSKFESKVFYISKFGKFKLIESRYNKKKLKQKTNKTE